MTSTFARRLTAEAVGTGFLVAAVVGSGVAAHRLSPTDTGLQLLENAIATGVVLTALILALGHVSAAFNPVISIVDHVSGAGREASTGQLVAVIAAQISGGAVGAVVANLMFDLPPVTLASTTRTGTGLWLGEVVATAGLVLIIAGASRTGGRETVALAVGGYIAGAYWFTSSTSFANPAVTLARTLSDTFAGVSPASVPGFLLAQAVGGVLGYLLARILFPRTADGTSSVRTPAVVASQEVS